MRNPVLLPLLLLLPLTLSGCDLLDVRLPGSVTDSRQSENAALTNQAAEDSAEEDKVPVIIAPTSDQEEVLQIMRYARVMQSYPRAKLKDEFKRVATDLVDKSDTANQLRMAILLSIEDTPFKNEKRALRLLTNIVNDVDEKSSALQEYAYQLLDTLQQRYEAMQLNRELSDELHAERQKRAQLQQQLDALRSIEKSINQRQLQNEAEKQ